MEHSVAPVEGVSGRAQERFVAPDTASPANDPILRDIVAIRDRWHTKRHPLFIELSKGTLDLRVLGVYMAQHGRFVKFAYQAFALMIVRASKDVQRMMIENLAEEEGFLAGPEGEAHNHSQMIYDFCEAAGMTREEVNNIEPTPAWWARALHYRHVCETEPIGVALAMLSTQEGQQPELNAEITIPAFATYYGYERDAREIKFFVEHELADEEHARRQLDLCGVHLQSPDVHDHAREVCEQACMLRWASTTDTYRYEALGQADPLPPTLR